MGDDTATNLERTSEEWEEWMDWDLTTNSRPNVAERDTTEASSEMLSPQPSPETRSASETPSASRKRKVSDESDDASVKAKRTVENATAAHNKSHSIVEKRYRTNLNQKIADLGDCIPKLRPDAQVDSGNQSITTQKHNKATILTEAMAYIRHLERRSAFLEEANAVLQDKVHAVSSKPVIADEMPDVEDTSLKESLDAGTSASRSSADSSPSPEAKPVRGMIKVPEDFRRLWNNELVPYNAGRASSRSPKQETSSDTKVSVKGKKHIGRLMVGSLAGLMVMDGLASTHEGKREDRGLSALPLFRSLPVLRRMWASRYSSMLLPSSHLCSPLATAFLLFGILGLLLFLYLFNSRPPPRKLTSNCKSQPQGILKFQDFPCIASPLEVRRRAWLTSIQTVWVPQHHVLPEMLALVLETLAYLTRHLLGWRSYSWFTGRSEDEEIARVRAWDIAIDAQLSGGDPEISKSRLVLTLWASGTLPNTPSRLMLKALHIRVLFWQPSRLQWLCRILDVAAKKLARYQWTKAHGMQRTLEEVVSGLDIEPLSEHLKAMLHQSSDEVMTDSIVQRAHNLVWNRPINEDCTDLESDIDEVVEDSAMRGPLDALSSWYSSLKLEDALQASLGCDKAVQGINSMGRLELAVSTAPPGSLSKARALAANAVLRERDRKAYVSDVLQHYLPSSAPEKISTSSLSSTIASVTASLPGKDGSDIAVSLKCAIALSTMAGSDCNSDEVGKACELLEMVDFKAKDMGLLGFCAARQLQLTVSLHAEFETQHLNNMNRIFEDKLRELDFQHEQKNDLDDRNQKKFGTCLRKVLERNRVPRRYSGASNDTGYESMND